MDLDAMDPAELEQDLGKYLSCFSEATPCQLMTSEFLL